MFRDAMIVDNFQLSKQNRRKFSSNMETILDRINKISENESITITSLEKNIGASKGVLSRAIAKKTDILSKWTQAIVENYPQYSAEWLLTGRGTMLRQNNTETQISYNPSVGVPYYDVDFTAGFDAIFNNQTLLPAHNIVFKPFQEAQLWCNVTGDSMADRINNGDIIALKEISIESILYGEIYAVVLDNIRTIKILRKATDPNKLRFIPIKNTAYNASTPY